MIKTTYLIQSLIVSSIISQPVLTLAGSVKGMYRYVYEPNGLNPGVIANDFRLRKPPGNFQLPSSDVFDNVRMEGNINRWFFDGGTLNPGDSHKVTLMGKVRGGRFRVPKGFFTEDGSRVSDDTDGRALSDHTVSFESLNGGFNINLSLFNDFDSVLTGSVEMFITRAGLDIFNSDNFDTLVNETLIFSDPNYILNSEEGFSNIQAQLASLDEYLLIRGTARQEGSLEEFEFTTAFSPSKPVSEPSFLSSTIILGILGISSLISQRNCS